MNTTHSAGHQQTTQDIVPGLGSVRVIEDEKMLQTAWMAYDKNGRCIASGVLGMGSLKHSDEIVSEIRVGKLVFAALKAGAK